MPAEIPIRNRSLSAFNSRLALGFFAALLLIGANLLIAFQSVRQMAGNNAEIARHYDVLAALRSIVLAVQEVESLQRGFIITGDDNTLPGYYIASAGIGQYLKTLKSLPLEGPLQTMLPQLELRITQRLAAGHQALELRRGGDFAAAARQIGDRQGAADMQEIRSLIARMSAHEGDLLAQGLGRSGINAWYALSTLLVATLVNLVLLGLVYRMVMRDLRQRNLVEGNLQAARDSAEAANQAKSMFLANMSHELRTPLNAILGYTELLQEEIDEQGLNALQHDLAVIHGESRHLLELISDILDLSKIEAGKMELTIESFSLETLLDELAQTVTTQMGRQGNAFQIKQLSPLGLLRSDRAKLRQILLNLLSNAAKFTHHGSVTLQVSCVIEQEREWALFQVADTGIGISAEQQQKLFQPFSQADSSTTRKYGGTGLGLALTRRFSEMLGGEVGLRSQLGQGSVFTVRIPVEWQAQRSLPRGDGAEDGLSAHG